jgi:hypothetical protein
LTPDDRVMVMIESDQLIAGRRTSRARVAAVGLSNDNIG